MTAIAHVIAAIHAVTAKAKPGDTVLFGMEQLSKWQGEYAIVWSLTMTGFDPATQSREYRVRRIKWSKLNPPTEAHLGYKVEIIGNGLRVRDQLKRLATGEFIKEEVVQVKVPLRPSKRNPIGEMTTRESWEFKKYLEENDYHQVDKGSAKVWRAVFKKYKSWTEIMDSPHENDVYRELEWAAKTMGIGEGPRGYHDDGALNAAYNRLNGVYFVDRKGRIKNVVHRKTK